MKFKVDEHLPEEFTQLLRSQGWDSVSLVDEGLGGAADARVAEVCSSESRIVVTFDRGFSNIKCYALAGLPGIIVFRLKRQDKPYLLNVGGRLVHELRQREPRGELWIVHDSRIRIRLLQ